MNLLAQVSAMGPTVQVNIFAFTHVYVNVMHYEFDFWRSVEVNTATHAFCTYVVNILAVY